MNKKLLIFAAIFLAGCDGATTEEEQNSFARVEKNLPQGCELHYGGSVVISGQRHKNNIFYVKCRAETAETTNTVRQVQRGKSRLTIDGITYEITPVDAK